MRQKSCPHYTLSVTALPQRGKQVLCQCCSGYLSELLCFQSRGFKNPTGAQTDFGTVSMKKKGGVNGKSCKQIKYLFMMEGHKSECAALKQEPAPGAQ